MTTDNQAQETVETIADLIAKLKIGIANVEGCNDLSETLDRVVTSIAQTYTAESQQAASATIQELQQKLNTARRETEEARLSKQDHRIGTATLKPIAPPIFRGNKRDDVDAWLIQLERNLECFAQNYNENQRITYASQRFEDNAQQWWCYREATNPITTWEAFKAAMKKEFKDSNATQNARDRLDKCRQTGPVTEYAARFRRILRDIPNMSEESIIWNFKKGLKADNVKALVQAHNPTTLEDAIEYADSLDSSFFTGRKSLRRPQTTQPSTPPTTPMDIDNVNLRPTRDECRQQGLCYYCKEPGHTLSNCPKRKKKMSVNNTESSSAGNGRG